MILRVTSGESKLLPRVFAYFFKIRSRTSSTRWSSSIVTSVADAPGRLTQTFLLTMLGVLFSSS
jgi:hypothetical protein